MEYYVLTQNDEIIGVFITLQDCLIWKPPYVLEGILIAHRVRLLDSGLFKIQAIILANTIFESNSE